MAWPSEAGSIAQMIGRAAPEESEERARSFVHGAKVSITPIAAFVFARRPLRDPNTERQSARSFVVNAAVFLFRSYGDCKGLYRIFNPVLYRLFRTLAGTPAESDTPFATPSTLPNEPSDTYADGVWRLSLEKFNGVIKSGFLPVGAKVETFRRLDLSGGVVVGTPPVAPEGFAIESRAGGVIRVRGWYQETGANVADQWAITFTTNISTVNRRKRRTRPTPIATEKQKRSTIPNRRHACIVKDRSSLLIGRRAKY